MLQQVKNIVSNKWTIRESPPKQTSNKFKQEKPTFNFHISATYQLLYREIRNPRYLYIPFSRIVLLGKKKNRHPTSKADLFESSVSSKFMANAKPLPNHSTISCQAYIPDDCSPFILNLSLKLLFVSQKYFSYFFC